jgi:conjugal transfer pilus assembly protein TraD
VAGRLTGARRSWLLAWAAVATGGLGLAAGAWLARRLGPRGGAAALAAALALALAAAAGLGLAWPLAFYRALAALLAGQAPGPRGWAALAAGWITSALAVAALRPRSAEPFGDPLALPCPPTPPRPPAPRPDGVELGTTRDGEPVVLTDGEANAHVLVLGATGTGKTNALLRILGSALERGLPVVVLDGKGSRSLAEALQARAARGGRTLAVWSPEGPWRYDPLRHGGPTAVRDRLVAVETWTEPYYRRAAERHLGLVLSTLEAVGVPRTLGAVAAHLPPDRLAALGRRLRDREAADRLYEYVDTMDPGTRSAALGLGHRLATLVESEAGPWLEPAAGQPVLDLREVVLGAGAALFRLDALRYPGLAAQAAALILGDLIAVVGELVEAGHRRPWYLGLDEWSALGAANVLTLLNKGREAGLAAVLATQDLADLVAVGGPALADQVLANTNVKVLLRQDVDASARRLAATVGTRWAWETSRRLGPWGDPVPDRERPVERPLLDPTVLKHLTPHEAVVVRKAPTPLLARVRLHRADA